jgi:hypothetical protein
MSYKGYDKDYVFLHVPFEESLKGGYDEGYYYDYCDSCNRRTEHDDGDCIDCCQRSYRESKNSY